MNFLVKTAAPISRSYTCKAADLYRLRPQEYAHLKIHLYDTVILINRAEQAAKQAEDALGQVQGRIDQATAAATQEAQSAARQAQGAADQANAAAGRAEAAAAELDGILQDGPVVSVNGKTGRVTLTAKDLQALPLPAAPQAGQVLVVKEVAGDGSVTLETKASVGGGFVLMEDEEIPPEERTEHTLYFQVTDKHDSGVTA